jgi:hypothetical protein
MAFFSRRAFCVPGRGMGLGREVSRALGPRRPVCSTSATHHDPMVVRLFSSIKTGAPASRNPTAHNPLSSLLSHSLNLTATQPTRGGRKRHRGPLIGALAHRWVDAPPSSGSTVGSTRVQSLGAAVCFGHH